MEFKQDEIDLVYSYWIDVSQDPEYIALETGLDRDRVYDIIEYLEKEGKINSEEINESKVLTFQMFQNL